MYLRSVKQSDVGTYACVASSYDQTFKKEFETVLAEPLSLKVETVGQSSEEVSMFTYVICSILFEFLVKQ